MTKSFFLLLLKHEKNTPNPKKIFELALSYNLKQMSLGKIARLVGESYPQTAKHHISQLQKKKLLDSKYKPIKPETNFSEEKLNERLVSLPIIGAANAGEATLIAEENIEGFLKVSPKIIGNRKNIFVLRVEGDSMDEANIDNRNIEDGDYVLVDGDSKKPKSGDYIVSIIDGAANIKKYIFDKNNEQIILISESKKKYLPIYIHKEDFSDYFIAGTVIQVLKPPKVEDISYEPFVENDE